jgi:hypothetical protein
VEFRQKFGWLGTRLFRFRCHIEICSFSSKGLSHGLSLKQSIRFVFENTDFRVHACCSTSPPIFSLALIKALTSLSINFSKSSIEGGRGSGAGVLAGEGVEEGFTGGAAEPDMAATVDECEESTDVAMSSSLDVAASSLRYIPVSLDIGAAIDLSMVGYARERHQCFGGKIPLDQGGEIMHVCVCRHGCGLPYEDKGGYSISEGRRFSGAASLRCWVLFQDVTRPT